MALALLTQMSMPPNRSTVFGDRLGDLRLVADVAQHRQRLAAGRLDLLGRRVDRARQFRMRLGGLGRDRDIGAVARRAQRDGQADAARAARDEQRLALERHEGFLQLLFAVILARRRLRFQDRKPHGGA